MILNFRDVAIADHYLNHLLVNRAIWTSHCVLTGDVAGGVEGAASRDIPLRAKSTGMGKPKSAAVFRA
jgi:hypothetical protein